MSNPDSKGNPDIAKLGKKFGDDRPDTVEQAIKGGEAKHAIRAKLRKLACHEVELDTETGAAPTLADIAKAWGREAKGTKIKLNMAEVWALQKSKQAMSDPKAMDKLIEHVDGKQTETLVHKGVETYADLVNAAAGNAPDEDDDEQGE